MKHCKLRLRREPDNSAGMVMRVLKNDQPIEPSFGYGNWFFPNNFEVGQEITLNPVYEGDLKEQDIINYPIIQVDKKVYVGAISLIYKNGGIVSIDCEKGRGWILPGGKHEPGETISQTAARELEEETGLVATRQELVWHALNTDGFYVYTFLTKIKEYKPKFDNVKISVWDELFRSNFKPYYELLRNEMIKYQHVNKVYLGVA